MSDSDDFTLLDDSALISRRAELRAELERLAAGSPGRAALAALYERSTEEIDDRARRAWSRDNPLVAGAAVVLADRRERLPLPQVAADGRYPAR